MRPIKNILRRSPIYKFFYSFRELRKLNQWTANDQKLLSFYSQFLSPGDLFFDVGAHIGTIVKIMLKLNTRVVAVEPQNECIKILRKAFAHNASLTIIHKALGESEGEADLFLSDARTISSMSSEWIEAVQKSGRFSGYTWHKKNLVQITTLDRLITQYGLPTFIKIDVEGSEYSVIKGLSRPVRMLSLEFTAEFMQSTFNSIDYLQTIGDIYLNYTLGFDYEFAMDEWISPSKMIEVLSSLEKKDKFMGDLYVKFKL